VRAKAAAVALVALATAALCASSASASQGEFVTVAGGKFGDVRWAFGVHGGGGERCYASLTTRPEYGEVWSGMSETCEKASNPRGEWRHILGLQLGINGGGADLQQTSARVHYLELRLSDPFGGDDYAPEWRRVRTKALGASESAKAKLGPGYRFAAVVSGRPFCVTAVRTFDRDRKLLRERRVPCEY